MQKKFMRSGKDQKIGGVCAGLAHYFDIDPKSYVLFGEFWLSVMAQDLLLT